MADALHPILLAIRSLLEGTTGATDLKVPTGRFRYVEEDLETLGPSVCAARPRPFNFRNARLIQGPSAPGDMTSGTYRRGAHQIELWVGYAAMPHKNLSLLGEMSEDESLIVSVLEYEGNVALTSEWEGCQVTDSVDADMVDDSDKPLARIRQLTLELSHRERQIT